MKNLLEFPSPYGVTVIKSYTEVDYTPITIEFPSPYGVTVIKSYPRRRRFK